MLCYDRIDFYEGVDVNKTSVLKKYYLPILVFFG